MEARARHQIVLLPLPLLLASLAATPQASEAQSIRRCNGADGTTIFTDRTCESFGATLAREIGSDDGGSSSPGAAPGMMGDHGAVGGFAIRGCARTQGELIAGVRNAVETGDVNLLANYYHWTGVSSSAAVGLMDRLDEVASATMSGVQFDYPSQFEYATAAFEPVAEPDFAPTPVGQAAYSPGPSFMDQYRAEHDDVPVLGTGIVETPVPTSPQPVALRVNHGGDGGTRFSLRQNAGCWFIQF